MHNLITPLVYRLQIIEINGFEIEILTMRLNKIMVKSMP